MAFITAVVAQKCRPGIEVADQQIDITVVVIVPFGAAAADIGAV